MCRLEDGVVYTTAITMMMIHGDPLMRGFNEIIDSVFAAGLYKFCYSMRKHGLKLLSRKIVIVHPIDGYYCFDQYNIQPAFYILLMGWCLGTLCLLV
jgi:hypothetical protein